MLNQLQSESMLNISSQLKANQQQYQYTQKQLQVQQKLQHQELLMENILNSHQQLSQQTYLTNICENSASKRVPSPTQTIFSDDWARSSVNPGNEENRLTQIGQIHVNQYYNGLSPQCTNSQSLNSNSWFDSNLANLDLQQKKLLQTKLNQANSSSSQLTLAQQQMLLANFQTNSSCLNTQSQNQQLGRSNSPIRLTQMRQNSLSRSETPNFVSNNITHGNPLSNVMNAQNSWQGSLNIEDFIPFGPSGNAVGGGNFGKGQSNFDQHNKLSAPINNLNEFGLTNVREFAMQSVGVFSETHSNSSPSPPEQHLVQNIGPIGSGFQPVITESLQQHSGFQGNGNLNPPVRQNGKMSSMVIRNKFGTLGSGRLQFNSPHGFCLGAEEEIIVADTNNHRINLFTKDGELKYSFGSPGLIYLLLIFMFLFLIAKLN